MDEQSSVSVVIPIYGGSDELRLCLSSLEECLDLISEVVVVDNASTDDAGDVAAACPFAKIMRSAYNTGFAEACNVGAGVAHGDIVIFLHSDTVVPRAGLQPLVDSLLRSGSIGAAGPYTNYARNSDQVITVAAGLDTLDVFAEQFAARDVSDTETDVLAGFCMAVRRSVLTEIGGFDDRFDFGFYSDFDLSYRIRRAGYTLAHASRSFVYHSGAVAMKRIGLMQSDLLITNAARYAAKWERDIESGFATHISGFAARDWSQRPPIAFDRLKLPEDSPQPLSNCPTDRPVGGEAHFRVGFKSCRLCLDPFTEFQEYELMLQCRITMGFLHAVLDRCAGIGTSCDLNMLDARYAVWLSKQGVTAVGMHADAHTVRFACDRGRELGGTASYVVGDMFDIYREGATRYAVIHHRGLIACLPDRWKLVTLAQQVAMADWVVFVVPVNRAPCAEDQADARAAQLAEWRRILSPFTIEELRCYGGSLSAPEHILCVLKGQPVTEELRELMARPPGPQPHWIARNLHFIEWADDPPAQPPLPQAHATAVLTYLT